MGLGERGEAWETGGGRLRGRERKGSGHTLEFWLKELRKCCWHFCGGGIGR